MLRRTVTVGRQYALHLWTLFLFVLAILLSLFMLAALLEWGSFAAIAYLIIVWCALGIAVSFYALTRIREKAAQIKTDVQRIKMMLNSAYGKYPHVRSN